MTLSAAEASSAGLWREIASSEPRIVVTGASGWLGRSTLDLTSRFGLNTVAFASGRRGMYFALDDLGAAPSGPGPLLLFHFAFLTQDRAAELGVEQYVAANLDITSRVLDWIRREEPDGIFLASSGAASRNLPLEVDPYGALKRVDEVAFLGAATEAGARLRTARIYNLAGANMTKPRNYALGDLVCEALAGRPLTIRSGEKVVRSYVGVRDLIALAMAELLSPDRPDCLRFDTYGYELEVGELASAVAGALARPDLPITRPSPGDGEPDVYVGDRTVMPALLARHGIEPTPLGDLIVETAESLR